VNKGLFLDRDGVINFDYSYVHTKENFVFRNEIFRVCKIAQQNKFKIIVVTNQAGIARGYYSEKHFLSFTSEINENLKEYGAHIDATYYCPHHPDGKGDLRKNCNCRKPQTGLLKKAIIDWNLDPRKCFLIGDKESDEIAAANSGISSFLFSREKNKLLEIFRSNLPTLKS
jgi:D-glycero-D-manno-heptose 1,7-bisphosphate phosphatase